MTSKRLHLPVGGTPDAALFDGGGLVIDLGIDVTDHPWNRTDDLWISRGPLHGRARIIAPPKAGTSGATIADSHIVVRNVTVMHAANDGFNIHGGWVGIRLENVRALSNADEGISAHGDVQLKVVGVEVAWNGSAAGGLADVGRSVTSYRECVVHHNLGAAFYVSGRSHRVEDTLSHDQSLDFAVQPGTAVDRVRVTWRK